MALKSKAVSTISWPLSPEHGRDSGRRRDPTSTSPSLKISRSDCMGSRVPKHCFAGSRSSGFSDTDAVSCWRRSSLPKHQREAYARCRPNFEPALCPDHHHRACAISLAPSDDRAGLRRRDHVRVTLPSPSGPTAGGVCSDKPNSRRNS